MSEMYFTKLLIADPLEKKAFYHQFSKGFNVVTSIDNHVGKSSVLKSLYYTLGAEVKYSDKWVKNTKVYCVQMCVDNKKYVVVRWHNNYIVYEGKKLICTTNRVGTGLAPLLADIFSFSIHLPNRKSHMLELAPPVFSFFPYYIDQDEGWHDMYGSFLNIEQYNKNDRLLCLYYHLNIYNQDTLRLMNEKDRLKKIKDDLEVEENNIRITIDNLSKEINNLLPCGSIEYMEESLLIPRERIADYVNKLGVLRNKIQSLEITLEKNKYHAELIRKAQRERKKVKKQEEKIPFCCPNCGYTVDDNIFDLVMNNYSEQSKEYIEHQFDFINESINKDLEDYKKQYIAVMVELKNLEEIYNRNQDSYNTYIRQRGLRDSLDRLYKRLGSITEESSKAKKELSAINRSLKAAISKKDVEEDYKFYAKQNLQKLDVWDEKYADSLELLKPVTGQGAQVNKIILAQYTALFKTIAKYRREQIVFPFVIDSPKTNEPSKASSREIIRMIFSIDTLPQVILATIDFKGAHAEYCTDDVNIVELNRHYQLLDENTYSKYEMNIKQFMSIFEQVELFSK